MTWKEKGKLVQLFLPYCLINVWKFFEFVDFDSYMIGSATFWKNTYWFWCLAPYFVPDSTFTEYIKALSPSTLDMELRMLQIIDDKYQQEPEQRQELHYIELLLEYFAHEIACRSNFEFIQAFFKLFLKVMLVWAFCRVFFFWWIYVKFFGDF